MVIIKSQRKVLLSHGEDGYFVVEVPVYPVVSVRVKPVKRL
jgi:hypothetical protein